MYYNNFSVLNRHESQLIQVTPILELWDKFRKKKPKKPKQTQKSITHLKVETLGHTKSLTITLPSPSYLQHSIALFIICPASTCHCFLTCMDLSYAAALASKFICFCRMKTFLLHLSKHTTTGKHSHCSCLCKQDWLICRLQPLVLKKGWFLQSKCILLFVLFQIWAFH